MKTKNNPGCVWVQVKPRDKPPRLIEVELQALISAGYTAEELRRGTPTMRSWSPPKRKRKGAKLPQTRYMYPEAYPPPRGDLRKPV